MMRQARRVGVGLGAMLLAGLLLASWVVAGPVSAGPSGGQPASVGGDVLAMSAAASCPTPTEGDLVQAPDDRMYLYANGTLRLVPDRETLRALGLDPNGANLIRDECLRSLRFGEPMPSAATDGQPVRSAATPDPSAVRDPAAPAVLLDSSEAQPARQSTVRLTARTDAPTGSGVMLAIHRTADDRPGASGLVTICSDTTACTVEVWEDEAVAWVFVATLYRCDAPDSCVAVRESDPVSVTWR